MKLKVGAKVQVKSNSMWKAWTGRRGSIIGRSRRKGKKDFWVVVFEHHAYEQHIHCSDIILQAVLDSPLYKALD